MIENQLAKVADDTAETQFRYFSDESFVTASYNLLYLWIYSPLLGLSRISVS
jgi:hypothetical protein